MYIFIRNLFPSEIHSVEMLIIPEIIIIMSVCVCMCVSATKYMDAKQIFGMEIMLSF